MKIDLSQLTPAALGIVKAGAANHFSQRRINPDTADYVLSRFLGKMAKTNVKTARVQKVAAIAETIRTAVHAERAAATK